MNNPNKTLIFKEDDFRGWLGKNSFAHSGDFYEQKYHGLVLDEFPRNEEFWRFFVVPLTNRMDSKNTDPAIHFREGVDDRLQYICGANYSLFVHLAMAKKNSDEWDDASLDAVYTRLGSAFDVFEALAIQLHFLFCECRGIKSALIEELKLPDFLKYAEAYYNKHYSNLHQFYVTIGKNVPPIKIPTRDSVLEEFFTGCEGLKNYLNISREIRTFRNAIVHDVRLGMLKNKKGEFMIPKSSKVTDYRSWAKVLAVAGDEGKISRDFSEVKDQCKSEILRTMQILNVLHGFILNQFQEEFYSQERSAIREVFGIKFQSGASELPVVLREPQSYRSASYETSFPGTSGTGLASGIINISGLNDL